MLSAKRRPLCLDLDVLILGLFLTSINGPGAFDGFLGKESWHKGGQDLSLMFDEVGVTFCKTANMENETQESSENMMTKAYQNTLSLR